MVFCCFGSADDISSKDGVSLSSLRTKGLHRAHPPQLVLEETAVPVSLNVYSLAESNSRLCRLGMGIFHTGVVVYGIEWGYGEAVESPNASGLFCVHPGQAAGRLYRTLRIGHTTKSPTQVDTILHRLENEWRSCDYHILHKNCNHFAHVFCDLLSTTEKLRVPSWCNRAARVSDKVVPRKLATKLQRMLDDQPPKASAPPRADHVSEIPKSVIPKEWYLHPRIAQPTRYHQKPLQTTVLDVPPPGYTREEYLGTPPLPPQQQSCVSGLGDAEGGGAPQGDLRLANDGCFESSGAAAIVSTPTLDIFSPTNVRSGVQEKQTPSHPSEMHPDAIVPLTSDKGTFFAATPPREVPLTQPAPRPQAAVGNVLSSPMAPIITANRVERDEGEHPPDSSPPTHTLPIESMVVPSEDTASRLLSRDSIPRRVDASFTAATGVSVMEDETATRDGPAFYYEDASRANSTRSISHPSTLVDEIIITSSFPGRQLLPNHFTADAEPQEDVNISSSQQTVQGPAIRGSLPASTPTTSRRQTHSVMQRTDELPVVHDVPKVCFVPRRTESLDGTPMEGHWASSTNPVRVVAEHLPTNSSKPHQKAVNPVPPCTTKDVEYRAPVKRDNYCGQDYVNLTNRSPVCQETAMETVSAEHRTTTLDVAKGLLQGPAGRKPQKSHNDEDSPATPILKEPESAVVSVRSEEGGNSIDEVDEKMEGGTHGETAQGGKVFAVHALPLPSAASDQESPKRSSPFRSPQRSSPTDKGTRGSPLQLKTPPTTNEGHSSQ